MRNDSAEYTFICVNGHAVRLRLILCVHGGSHCNIRRNPPVRDRRKAWHRHLQRGDEHEQ